MKKTILVTGASGFVGNSLIPNLLEKGYPVRVLVRTPQNLEGRTWLSAVQVAKGDLLDPQSLPTALKDVSTAYYLIHNMSSGKQYETREIISANNFSTAASQAGLEHIIYLGGLAHKAEAIGSHLRSRLETGDTLREGTVPVTEFRASLIIGSGSISFEMIRFLTERLPLLVGSTGLRNLAQPIAIQDVLEYLLAALEMPTVRSLTYEIGGGEVLSYAGTMLTYAQERGLKRACILLPWVPPGIMAFLVGKLAPIPARIAGPLIGGMHGSSIVRDGAAKQAFPGIKPLGYRSAVRLALEMLHPEQLDPVWRTRQSDGAIMQEGFLIEKAQVRLEAPIATVYQIVTNLGGQRGWLTMNWLWKLRGFLDKILGGPGMRGRTSADSLSEGDILDFYQVECLIPSQLVRLRSELKAPGQGWMEWHIRDVQGSTILTQAAFFAPCGMPGFLYWSLFLPFHRLVLRRLIQAINRRVLELKIP